MDSTEQRHANFMVLYKEFREARAELPDRGMLKLFAEHIGTSDRYLSHIKCNRKQIGSATARQIEEAMGKPHGWMDQKHGDLDPRTIHERAFMETALALFRDKPAEAQAIMTTMLKDRLAKRE